MDPAGRPPTISPPPPRRSRRGFVGSLVRQATRSAATAPGRLAAIAVGLVTLTVLTGLVAALSLQQKVDTIDGLVTYDEPLSVAAQEIYRALSDADATAASAFLSGGVEPEGLRARYETDIARAGSALAKASADIGVAAGARAQVDVLSTQLPVYTGLVETARTNNRQGFPSGAAYLREASALMRAQILPAAQELYRMDADRLTRAQDDATDIPWLAVALAVSLAGAIVASQVYLTRTTNRLLNVGLVVASGAVLVALIWSTVALIIESVGVNDGREGGSSQVDALVRIRITALGCRADETLTLVARGDGPGYEQNFARNCGAVSGLGTPDDQLTRARHLADEAEAGAASCAIDAAIGNAKGWHETHRRIRELDDGGDYDRAVTMAIGMEEGNAAADFYELDTNLVNAIAAGRATFYEQTSKAGWALTGLVPGVVVLALVAAGATTMGIRQRLLEYR